MRYPLFRWGAADMTRNFSAVARCPGFCLVSNAFCQLTAEAFRAVLRSGSMHENHGCEPAKNWLMLRADEFCFFLQCGET